MHKVEGCVEIYNCTNENFVQKALPLPKWESFGYNTKIDHELQTLKVCFFGKTKQTKKTFYEALSLHWNDFYIHSFAIENLSEPNKTRETTPLMEKETPHLSQTNINSVLEHQQIKPFVQKKSKALVEIINQSDDFLEQVLASWVLHQTQAAFEIDKELCPENTEFLANEIADLQKQIDNLLKNEEKRLKGDKTLDFLVGLDKKYSGTKACHYNIRKFLSICTWSNVPEDFKKEFLGLQKSLQTILSSALKERGCFGLYETAQKLVELSQNLEKFCQNNAVPLPKTDSTEGYIKIWKAGWKSFVFKNQDIIIQKSSQKLLAQTQELAAYKQEQRRKKLALGLFEERKKVVPNFEEQNFKEIFENMSLTGLRHVVFAKGFFKDGLSYSNLGKVIKSQKNFVFYDNSSFIDFNRKTEYNSLYKAFIQKYNALPHSLKNRHLNFFTQGCSAYQNYLVVEKLDANTLDQLCLQIEDNAQISFAKDYKQMFETVEAFAKLYSTWLLSNGKIKPSVKEGASKLQLSVEGYIKKDCQDKTIGILKNNGAKLVENDIFLPNYNSWAKLSPGMCYKLEKSGTTISYVPGEDYIVKQNGKRRKVDLLWHREEIKKRARTALQNEVLQTEDLFLLSWNTKKSFETNTVFSLQSHNFSKLEKNNLRACLDKKEQPLASIKKTFAIPAGTSVTVENGGQKFQEIVFQHGYRKQFDGTFLHCTDDLFLILEGLNTISHHNSTIHQDCFDEQDNLVWSGRMLDRNFKQKFSQWHLFCLCQKHGLLDDLVEETKIEKDLASDAPKSEAYRFCIKTDDCTTEGLEKIYSLLQQLKIVSQIYKQVPNNLVPGDRHLVNVSHKDYLVSLEQPQLPKDYGILHGLTGVDTASEAFKRLESIVKTGGIYSIRTRRHLGLKVRSLSPLGDIASGIDHGVPTTLGKKHIHGSKIFFLLKDNMLARRDLWFADRDFGGGESRENLYENYAKSLGYKGFKTPPPARCRERHIMRLHNHKLNQDNETYFEDGISLNEIDSIFFTSDMQPMFNQSVLNNWVKNYAFPASIKMVCVSNKDVLQKSIAKRLKEVRAD